MSEEKNRDKHLSDYGTIHVIQKMQGETWHPF